MCYISIIGGENGKKYERSYSELYKTWGVTVIGIIIGGLLAIVLNDIEYSAPIFIGMSVSMFGFSFGITGFVKLVDPKLIVDFSYFVLNK